MATKEEVLAAAQRAEAAGDTAAAAKLRAYADTLEAPQYDRAKIEAAAEKAKAAGDTAAFEKLSAFAQTLPGPAQPEPEITAPPRVEAQQAQAAEMATGELAAFEAANPKLKGMFQPGDELPAVGSGVRGVYDGGGGRSGGIPYQVKDWKGGADTWTDTAGAMMEGPLSAMSAFAGGLSGGESPTREFLANDPLTRNLPGPVLTGLGAVGDFGGAGLSLLGAGMGAGAGLASELVPGQSAQDEQKLAGDLSGMAMFAAPELAGVSSVGAMAGGAGRAAKAAGAIPDAPTTAMQAARELGVTPSLGMKGPTRALLAAGLEKVPFSGAIIGADAVRAVKGIETAFHNIRDSVGVFATPSAAGEKLQKGLRGVVDQFKARASELYADVGKHVPKGQKFPIENTLRSAEEAKAAFADTPELAKFLGRTEFDKVLAEAGQNGLTWDALKAFRTDIGEALGKSGGGALKDTGQATLSRLYGSLTDDMQSAIAGLGEPAKRAWARANKYYKEGAEKIERNIDSLIGKDPMSGPSSERAFEAFDAMAKADRATSDISRMRAIKASIDPKIWADTAASIVGRYGDNGGQFSPQKFLTEWGKMSGEAKDLLLPKAARKTMDKLVQVAEAAKKANAERNFSNTGTVATLLATGAGGVSNLPVTVGLLAGSALTAKALTSPRLLGGIEALMNGVRKPLEVIAKSDSPLASEARKILNAASNSGKSASAPAAAQQNQAPDYEGLRRRYAQ